MNEVEPPIGIKPKWLHEEHLEDMDDFSLEYYSMKRYFEIKAAIKRYLAVNKFVPEEWILEFDELESKFV